MVTDRGDVVVALGWGWWLRGPPSPQTAIGGHFPLQGGSKPEFFPLLCLPLFRWRRRGLVWFVARVAAWLIRRWCWG